MVVLLVLVPPGGWLSCELGTQQEQRERESKQIGESRPRRWGVLEEELKRRRGEIGVSHHKSALRVLLLICCCWALLVGSSDST